MIVTRGLGRNGTARVLLAAWGIGRSVARDAVYYVASAGRKWVIVIRVRTWRAFDAWKVPVALKDTRAWFATRAARVRTIKKGTDMKPSFFDWKDPTEAVVLTFDFTNDLAAGETLTGAITTQVTVYFGTDASPSALLNGAASYAGGNTKVQVPVHAGLEGVHYQVKVICATTNPLKTLAMVGVLPVVTQ